MRRSETISRMLPEFVRQLGRGTPDDEVREPLGQSPRLGEHLSGRIAELIRRGDFGQQGRLPSELALAKQFGVSRPVVREALSRLRSQGVIVSRRGSGSYICSPTEQGPAPLVTSGFGPVDSLAAVRKCFEFRTGVEGEAAYYAARNHTPKTLSAIREALAQMEAATNDGTVSMYMDLEFHLTVARASGNEFFEIVMQSMRLPIEFAINLARSLTLTRPLEHLRTVQNEHVVLFEAIEARDEHAARHAMRAHVENACSRVFEGPGGGVSRAEDSRMTIQTKESSR
jgi:GntR family transcriptional regulator, transcriptional repressor for pyruvate dehydrogenase complex